MTSHEKSTASSPTSGRKKASTKKMPAGMVDRWSHRDKGIDNRAGAIMNPIRLRHPIVVMLGLYRAGWRIAPSSRLLKRLVLFSIEVDRLDQHCKMLRPSPYPSPRRGEGTEFGG